MSWREFVVRLVESIAWPLAAVLLALLLRDRLINLLSSGIKRVKAGPVEVEMWERLAETTRSDAESGLIILEEGAAGAPPLPRIQARSLRDELEGLARDRPREAVLQAHTRVERQLRELVEKKVPVAADAPDGVSLAGLAAAHKLINAKTLQALEGLNVLRNLAVHSRVEELGPRRAMEYLDLADGTLYALRVQMTDC